MRDTADREATCVGYLTLAYTKLASLSCAVRGKRPPVIEPMPDYRLYFLNLAGGIDRALDIQCQSDEEAVAFAEAHEDRRAKELWQGARYVALIPPLLTGPKKRS